jgi:hypothetical protein
MERIHTAADWEKVERRGKHMRSGGRSAVARRPVRVRLIASNKEEQSFPCEHYQLGSDPRAEYRGKRNTSDRGMDGYPGCNCAKGRLGHADFPRGDRRVWVWSRRDTPVRFQPGHLNPTIMESNWHRTTTDRHDHTVGHGRFLMECFKGYLTWEDTNGMDPTWATKRRS